MGIYQSRNKSDTSPPQNLQTSKAKKPKTTVPHTFVLYHELTTLGKGTF